MKLPNPGIQAGIAGLVGVVVLAAVAMYSPAQLEEFPPLCLVQWLFDTPCWGCGTVRAFSSLVRGRFVEAWEYNWRIFAVVPLIAGAGLQRLERVFENGKTGDGRDARD